MSRKRLLVIYYTQTGNTEMLAREIAKGAREHGITVRIKRVEECTVDELRKADAIAIGSPTYFSNIAWQVKKLVDESIALYGEQELAGKVVGIFTSSGTKRDARDCIRMLRLAFGYHHRMRVVEPPLIRIDGEPDDRALENARQYGEAIVKAMLESQ